MITDTLSRTPLSVSMEQEDVQAEVSTFIDNVISHLSATNKRLDEYREAESQDQICSQVINFVSHNGHRSLRQVTILLHTGGSGLHFQFVTICFCTRTALFFPYKLQRYSVFMKVTR